MKTILLIILAYSAFTHSNWAHVLTNDVPVDSNGIRMILSPDGLTNVIPSAGGIMLFAEKTNFWMFHNTSSNIAHLVYPRGHLISTSVFTANGIAIPTTELGKKMNEPQESDGARNLKSVTILPGEFYGGEFSKFTDLFIFPSNGVYTVESRCRVWSNPKKQFVLSDPVRVNIIKEDTRKPAK